MENQYNLQLRPLGKGEHIQFETISEVPDSKWYKYTLLCEHEVYSRVKIRVPRDYSFMEHYIRCAVVNHTPVEWIAITAMEAVNDEHVSNVSSGSSFILPNRILRVDGHYAIRIQSEDVDLTVVRAHNSGNPYPYSSKDREY